MFSKIRSTVSQNLVSLTWKINRDKAARTLKDFSETEADSGWQYLHAIRYSNSQNLSRKLFENVLEERRHADYFEEVAHKLATVRLSSNSGERLPLIESSDGMPYFLAYAYLSEKSIHEQFNGFAIACPYKEVSEVFLNICDDEEEHQSEAAGLLDSLLDDDKEKKKLISKVKWSKAKDIWVRSSEKIGNVMSSLVLRVMFYFFGIFFIRNNNANK